MFEQTLMIMATIITALGLAPSIWPIKDDRRPTAATGSLPCKAMLVVSWFISLVPAWSRIMLGNCSKESLILSAIYWIVCPDHAA